MDAIEDIKNLLNQKWNPVNTDNITPLIDLIVKHKRVDLSYQSAILIYQNDRLEKEVSISANEKNVNEYIRIDIRTMKSREHFLKLWREVERIIDENCKCTPGWTFVHIERTKDLSDRSRGLWRMVIDVEMYIIARRRPL